MTKINFMKKHVEELTVKELKEMIKENIESTGFKIKGYHDFNKEQLIEEVINLYADFIEDEEFTEEVANEVETLTELETKMLNLIPQDNFYDGDIVAEDLESLLIWTDCFLEETWKNPNQGRGVLSSLVKKDMIEISKGKDSTISLTEKAIKFIIENNKKEIETPKETEENDFKYLVKNPEGEIVKKFQKLKDAFSYAEENGICTKGWVSLSIERNIPVLIGLGRDKEITEDFVPRVTKKYNGNYWKFEKI